MRAAAIHIENGIKVLRTVEVPDPTCAPDQVVVRVRAAGICGSDVHGFFDASGTSRAAGLIMGHEPAGDVVEVGAAVDGVAVGDRVTIDPQVVCGKCEACRNGWISICDNKRVLGSSLRGFEQGSMAELVAVHHAQVHQVPSSLGYAEAALIEPLSNALHVVRRSEPAPTDVVVVLGMGPLGLCMVPCLKAAGVENVVVTDVAPHRLDLARTMGADHVALGNSDELPELVRDLTGGTGADIVVESVGVNATYQQAISVVRKRGRVMFFGAVQDTVTLPLLPILHKEIQLIGCTGANDETTEAIELASDGRVDLSALLTHHFGLDDAQAAFEVMRDPAQHAVKVQVDPAA